MTKAIDLYEYPEGYQGRKRYVTVPGHGVVAAYYTYHDGSKNRILPEFGGDPIDNKATGHTVHFMNDIGAYTSTVDGSRITTRSEHRDHIRQHDLIEVGNERMPSRPQENTSSIGRDIQRTMHQLRERG